MSLFSRRVFGAPDTFKLVLEYSSPTLHYEHNSGNVIGSAQVRLPVAVASLAFEFNCDESDAAIVERFLARKKAALVSEELVVLKLVVEETSDLIYASRVHKREAKAKAVSLQLSTTIRYPVLRCMQFLRVNGNGNASDSAMQALLRHCDLATVWKMKGAEGFGHVWCTGAQAGDWIQLRNMNLSHCGLTTLPAAIGDVSALRILRLSYNKLTTLPAELQALSELEILAADHNLLVSIPAELRSCSSLRELNLEGNKINTPVLDLRSLSHLQSLQLFGNPLEYLPELSPCTQLRSLSLANVRIMADANFTRWEVEVGALPYMSRGHKLSPLFKLTFRRTSLQHPLLAGALGRIAEDRVNCELISKEEAAIRQLVLMALSENPVVVNQACKTIGHIAAYSPMTAKQLMDHAVLSAVVTLIQSPIQDSQICGLGVLSSLATGCDSVSAKLLSPGMLQRLQDLIRLGDPSVRQASLFALSNLSFCRDNKVAVRKAEGLLQALVELAQPHASQGTSDTSRLMAVRVLAVLGENEQVRLALRAPAITGRGLRILSLDGGGMRGLVTVHMLRHLERRLGGRPLSSMFDIVVGTSTGAIQAVSLGMLSYTLDECEDTYMKLAHKVFNSQVSAAARESEMATWKESLYRMYKSGSQSMRVAVYGCKHDASTFENLLKDMCNLVRLNCVSDQLIDAAVLGGPKVVVVATLASFSPAAPYVFRSYELPQEADQRAAKMGACKGSSKHLVWQAIRASAAAPYYLDDYTCGDERFQDGAATANNPTLIAIQQARLLWPDLPLDCVVSMGSGLIPSKPRERSSMSSHLDTGNVLIESACSTERVHEAVATLLQMVPGVRYFRFQPEDDRCTIELDDIDPANWAKLKEGTEEFCVAHAARFDEAGAALLASETAAAVAADQEAQDGDALVDGVVIAPVLCLGPRRGLLLLEAPCTCNRGLYQPGATLTERVANLVAGMQGLTRRADISATAGDRPDLAASKAMRYSDRPGGGKVAAVNHPMVSPVAPQGDAGSRPSALHLASWASSAVPHLSGDGLTGFGSLQEMHSERLLELPEAAPDPSSASASRGHGHGLGNAPGMRRTRLSSMDGGQARGIPPSALAGGSQDLVMALAQQPAPAAADSPRASAPAPGDRSSSFTLTVTASKRRISVAGTVPVLPSLPWSTSPRLAESSAPDPLGVAAPSVQVPALTSLGTIGAPEAKPATPRTTSASSILPSSPNSFLNYFIPSSWTLPATSSGGLAPAAPEPGPSVPNSLPQEAVAMAAEGAAAAAAAGANPEASLLIAGDRTDGDEAPLATAAGGGATAAGATAAAAATTAAAANSSERPGQHQHWHLSSHAIDAVSPTTSPRLSMEAERESQQELQQEPAHRTESSPDPPIHPAPFTHPDVAQTNTDASGTTGLSPSAAEAADARTGGAGLGGGTSAFARCGDGSGGGLQPQDLMRGLLQDLSEEVGVVHLALHSAASAAGGAGLVMQWSQEVFAVAEPGPDASKLVLELGGDPAHTSLSQLCAGRPAPSCFQAGDSQLLKLAHQEVTAMAGTQVSSFLFQRTSPQRLLLPEHVQAMAGDWMGLLVTSATPLSAPLAEELLRAGVKAVVAPAEEAWEQAVRAEQQPPGGTSTSKAESSEDAPCSSLAAEPHLVVKRTRGSCGRAGSAGASQAAAGPAAGVSAGRVGGTVVPECLEEAVLAFFAAFYAALMSGETVLSAIQAGEVEAPGIEDMYVCYHL